MAGTALHDLSLAEAAALVRTRELSPVEYTRTVLARTDALEPQLNAARFGRTGGNATGCVLVKMCVLSKVCYADPVWNQGL